MIDGVRRGEENGSYARPAATHRLSAVGSARKSADTMDRNAICLYQGTARVLQSVRPTGIVRSGCQVIE